MSDSVWKSCARAPLAVRATVALTITLAFLVIPAFGDQWAYAHIHQANVYGHDWAMALRACGTLYIWIPVALIFWLVKREQDPADAKRTGLLILGAPALAGLLCEVLKLVIRRERPNVDMGNWVFRAWSDHPFSSAGLSTPSSHTMVAFGAATILARMYPRARWVFYLFAVGCAVTRVMDRAHYISDVTFGALLGWAVAWGVWMQWGMSRTEDRRPKTEGAGSRRPEAG
jgi:membrane-associated phospholipid phosphatase